VSMQVTKSPKTTNAVHLHENADDLLAAIYTGRHVPIDPLQESSLDLCRSWIRTCEAEHNHKLQAREVLPGRILEVMNTSIGVNIVTLREEFRELERYACLSHCWGSSQHLKTTCANISAMKEGIAIADLAKTFQDAIIVTKELGLRYLWIDSLCIIQDDKDDWEQESAKMSSIFENAYITIAASCAADDRFGFLSPRPQRDYISFQNSHVQAFAVPPRYFVSPENLMLMPDEPVNKRAWTLQERLLSLRTLHFGRSQISFECKSEFWTEDGYMRCKALNYMNRDKVNAQSSLHDSDLQAPWNRIVKEYSNRELTFAIDKLPALGGLAHRFDLANYSSTDKNRSSKYLAGLWRHNLIIDLNWWPQNGNCTSAPSYRAPSWSWASIDGPVSMGLSTPHSILAEVEDSFLDVLGKNPYGTIQGGWLKLRCVAVPVHFGSDYEEQGNGMKRHKFTMSINGYCYTSGPHYLDYRREYLKDVTAMELHFLCLILRDQPYGKYVRGLVVRSFDSDPRNNITTQVFRRIARTDFSDKCADEILAMYTHGIVRSVTLV
jgi:hypothetical protein